MFSKSLNEYNFNERDRKRFGLIPPSQSDELTMTKTHDAPLDNGKCIYIVRDGRTAIVSYFHYLNDIVSADVSLEQVLAGETWPGSWSEHVQAWSPKSRHNTLLVKYERLRDANEIVCEEIGHFLGFPPLRRFGIAFSDLHEMHPKFFRQANDTASLAEIQHMEILFLKYHGNAMRYLGYI